MGKIELGYQALIFAADDGLAEGIFSDS